MLQRFHLSAPIRAPFLCVENWRATFPYAAGSVTVVAIKWCATSVSSGWDDEVQDAPLRNMLTKTVARVTRDNPVWGDWCIDKNEFTIWVAASSLAMGVALEANSAVMEDACWLQPENDAKHINLAELDTTLKRVNLALQWQARVLHIVTLSVYASVDNWHTDWKDFTDHQGIEWNADTEAAGHVGWNHQGIQLGCRHSID